MIPLLLGFLLLATVVALLKLYAEADIKMLKLSLRWAGVIVGLAAVVFLAARGLLPEAGAFLVGLVAWMWRAFHVVRMLREMGILPGAKPGDSAKSGAAGHGAMDTEEALRVLGLSPGATTDEIKAAHRRLMAQLHPDHGGSDYLAGKINAARDHLLRDRR